MQEDVAKLIWKLGEAYPKPLTIGELKDKGVTKDAIDDAIDNVIELQKGHITKKYGNHNEAEECNLNIKGLELYNHIRLKATIEQLDSSIKKFNESSDRASIIMTILTVIIAIMTGVQLATALKWI